MARCSRSMQSEYGCCDHPRVDQLFDAGDQEPAQTRTRVPRAEQPLPVRMRPAALDAFVGQEHILGPDSALRRAIEEGKPHSMILYGPPGTGKTTLARMLATNSQAAFEELSAVEAGRAEVRELMKRAEERLRGVGQPTIFFLDEIHRFNKAQQDALLPAVEEGLVTLVGATTENPYFEVNSALISRCRVYELRLLSDADVRALLERALREGFVSEEGSAPPRVDDDALDFLAARSAGDARTALAALEIAAENADPWIVPAFFVLAALFLIAVGFGAGGGERCHGDSVALIFAAPFMASAGAREGARRHPHTATNDQRPRACSRAASVTGSGGMASRITGLLLAAEIHRDDVRAVLDRLRDRMIVLGFLVVLEIPLVGLRLELKGEIDRGIDETGDRR